MNTHSTAECSPQKSASLAASYRPSRPADVERLGRGGRAVRRALPVLFRTIASLVLIAVGIGVVLLLGKTKPPATQDSVAAPHPVVEVTPIAEHVGGIDFTVHGVVVPFRQVDVPAEVAGTVAFRSDNCRVGRTVSEGELLLRIDAQDYALEVRRLQEQLRQAQAEQHELDVETAARRRQIELAQEDLAIKQRELARYEKIDDPGVYSKSELDAARLKELQARAALQTERDQLELLEARRERLAASRELVASQLDKAQLDQRRTEVRAPIDGVITAEPVERGAYVQRGGVVAVIRDTSRMEVKCSLQMHQMHWLWQGAEAATGSAAEASSYRFPETPATVVYRMRDAEYRWEGTLHDYDGAEVDQQTRMVPCRVIVPNPASVVGTGKHRSPAAPAGLMAGMFVTVQVHASPRVPLFRVPEAAIQPGNTVWVVSDVTESNDLRRGQLRGLKVDVAYGDAKSALIYGSNSSLSAGMLIVASPVASPVDGMTVELLAAEKPESPRNMDASAAKPTPSSRGAG